MSRRVFTWDDDTETLEEIACLEALRRYGLSPYQLQRLVVARAVRRPWIDGRPMIVISPVAHRALLTAGRDMSAVKDNRD